MGKTVEKVSFEGIASTIIHGRNKQALSSSAAQIIAIVKIMSTMMNINRQDMTYTRILNLNENPSTT